MAPDQCLLHEKLIKDISGDIKDVLKLLNGNGEIGMCAKVELHDQYITKQAKTKAGYVTFIVRTVFGILLVYIAAKLGLR